MQGNKYINCEGSPMISRRRFLQASAILSFAGLPELSLGQGVNDKRLLVVLLRGGLDGLYAVPPVGDRRLAALRRNINPDNTLRLNGDFALHPQLQNIHEIYEKGEGLIVHAASIPYTARSHFEGQNVMESGDMTPYASESGWMGRGLDLQGYHSLALSLPAPLILRGEKRPSNYYPTWLSKVPNQYFDALMPLWAADSSLAPIGDQVLEEREMNTFGMPGLRVGQRNALTTLASEAGNRLRVGEGPRMAVLDHVGFDTHANEPSDASRVMREVDEAIGSFRSAIGDEVWKDTYVVTVTEFGRTVAENGSLGTDHGYGTAVFVLGGALKQGGVVTDWPGLSDSALYEGRDLMATIDARSVYGKVMSEVLGVDPELVQRQVIAHEPTTLFDGYI